MRRIGIEERFGLAGLAGLGAAPPKKSGVGGALLGAGVGFAVGGPPGALVGAVVGAAFGGKKDAAPAQKPPPEPPPQPKSALDQAKDAVIAGKEIIGAGVTAAPAIIAAAPYVAVGAVFAASAYGGWKLGEAISGPLRGVVTGMDPALAVPGNFTDRQRRWEFALYQYWMTHKRDVNSTRYLESARAGHAITDYFRPVDMIDPWLVGFNAEENAGYMEGLRQGFRADMPDNWDGPQRIAESK